MHANRCKVNPLQAKDYPHPAQVSRCEGAKGGIQKGHKTLEMTAFLNQSDIFYTYYILLDLIFSASIHSHSKKIKSSGSAKLGDKGLFIYFLAANSKSASKSIV